MKIFMTQANDKKQIKCFNCEEIGHIARNCPAKNRAPNRNNSSQRIPIQCDYCKALGHALEKCYKFQAYKNLVETQKKSCTYCNANNHTMKDCPIMEELTTALRICKKCKSTRHITEEYPGNDTTPR